MKQQLVMTMCTVLVPLALVGGYVIGTSTLAVREQAEHLVRFSPDGGSTQLVVSEIDAASHSIQLQAYSLTSAAIARALVDAHERGVNATVVLDQSQRSDPDSEAATLERAGVATYVDSKHAAAHNEIILIDGRTIITGSFDFTNQAEQANAENVLVIRREPALFVEYQENFVKHLAHSERYHPGSETGFRHEPVHAKRPTSSLDFDQGLFPSQ